MMQKKLLPIWGILLLLKQQRAVAAEECALSGKKKTWRRIMSQRLRKLNLLSAMAPCTWKNILKSRATLKYRLQAINMEKHVIFQKEIALFREDIKNF